MILCLFPLNGTHRLAKTMPSTLKTNNSDNGMLDEAVGWTQELGKCTGHCLRLVSARLIKFLGCCVLSHRDHCLSIPLLSINVLHHLTIDIQTSIYFNSTHFHSVDSNQNDNATQIIWITREQRPTLPIFATTSAHFCRNFHNGVELNIWQWWNEIQDVPRRHSFVLMGAAAGVVTRGASDAADAFNAQEGRGK